MENAVNPWVAHYTRALLENPSLKELPCCVCVAPRAHVDVSTDALGCGACVGARMPVEVFTTQTGKRLRLGGWRAVDQVSLLRRGSAELVAAANTEVTFHLLVDNLPVLPPLEVLLFRPYAGVVGSKHMRRWRQRAQILLEKHPCPIVAPAEWSTVSLGLRLLALRQVVPHLLPTVHHRLPHCPQEAVSLLAEWGARSEDQTPREGSSTRKLGYVQVGWRGGHRSTYTAHIPRWDSRVLT